MRSLLAAMFLAGLVTLPVAVPTAYAQGTLVAPGGQSRVTAPGGLRRGMRRPAKRMPTQHRHRRGHHRR